MGVAELTPKPLASTVSTWVNIPTHLQTGGTHTVNRAQVGDAGMGRDMCELGFTVHEQRWRN